MAGGLKRVRCVRGEQSLGWDRGHPRVRSPWRGDSRRRGRREQGEAVCGEAPWRWVGLGTFFKAAPPPALVEGEMVNCGVDREIGVQEHASEGGTEGCPSGTACLVPCSPVCKGTEARARWESPVSSAEVWAMQG